MKKKEPTHIIRQHRRVVTGSLAYPTAKTTGEEKEGNLRDLLPDTFDVTNFGLTTQFTFRSDFPCDLLHLSGECSKLVNHTIDGVHQIQHLSGDTDTDHLLGEITSRNGRLRVH